MRMKAMMFTLIFSLILCCRYPQVAFCGFSVGIASAEFAISPGSQSTGHVTAMNTGSEPVSVKAYVGDWRDIDGGTKYSKPGTEPRSLSRWMNVRPARLVIPPGGSEIIYYEIALPDDPSISGSYWGMVFVEEIASTSIEHPDSKEGMTLGISTVMRYAAKVFATVVGTEERKAVFTSADVSPADAGGLNVTAFFENQSNVYLKPHIWIELTDSTGKQIFTQDYRETIVFPETTRKYDFELRNLNLQTGIYNSMIIADYGTPDLIAAQVEINIQ